MTAHAGDTVIHIEQQLVRVLGIAFGLAVVIGGMVGQGIMRSPGIVAGAVGAPLAIMAVWLVGGLLSALDAFSTAELAASHPRAGGPYALARRAFGPLAGTMIGWTDWLQGVVSIGFIAVVFGEYVHELGLAERAPVGLISVLLLASIGALHWHGTRVCGASQTTATALKALMMLGLVAALALAPGAPADPSPGPSPAVTLAGVVIALRLTLTTYAGWNASCYFSEEMHEPERNVARATFMGIGLVTLLYLAVNAALLHVMTPAQLASSKLPAADALQRTLGGSSGLVITIIAVISVGAIANLMCMQFTRVAFAVSRDGALPAFLSQVAPGGTPRLAMVTTIGFAMLFAASGTYETLVTIAAVPGSLILLAIDLAAMRLRRIEPDLPRPFRMPLFPLPALVGALCNIAIIAAMVWQDPANSLIGIVLLACVGVVYIARDALVRRAPA
ncbi:APC family permease [Novosphingobium tardum]|uniref:APC family permease n=1 Tax=Novosphingobium tardum TaxID=1538021 RepID=A0ABV8RMC8_9SPHN